MKDATIFCNYLGILETTVCYLPVWEPNNFLSGPFQNKCRIYHNMRHYFERFDESEKPILSNTAGLSPPTFIVTHKKT